MPHSDYVTIVSGLPRSGTSMMMRMLDAGGLTAITDNVRTADTDNPRGYYEFEPVKKTKEDPSWVNEAHGKVVKMVYLLLFDLPPEHSYRVVFMRRKLEEVVASQNKMLVRSGQEPPPPEADAQMLSLFRQELERVEQWLKAQPNFVTHDVNYNELLTGSPAEIAALNEFLGGELNTDAMAQVVDPTLYRNRK